MFSGIVETTATVTQIAQTAGGVVLTLRTSIPGSEIDVGESICISGTCLTVTTIQNDRLDFDVSTESLRRTTLGDLRVGNSVNLERSLRLDDRLSGHLVFGHVDGVGRVESLRPEGDSFLYTFSVPSELSRYLVEKGSVAVDGISLTVFSCHATEFSCAIIPHTHAVTTLHQRRAGDRVNIETDMQGKYIEKFVRDALEGMFAPRLQALRDELAALREKVGSSA